MADFRIADDPVAISDLTKLMMGRDLLYLERK